MVVLDDRGLASLWTNTGERVLRWKSWKSEATLAGNPQAEWTPDGCTLLTVDGPLVQQRDGKTGALHYGDERFPRSAGLPRWCRWISTRTALSSPPVTTTAA